MPTIALIDYDLITYTSTAIAPEGEVCGLLSASEGILALEGFKHSPPDVAAMRARGRPFVCSAK